MGFLKLFWVQLVDNIFVYCWLFFFSLRTVFPDLLGFKGEKLK